MKNVIKAYNESFIMNTLRTEALAEESFAISRFLAQFAKVYPREKNKSFRLAKVKKSKNK